MELLFKFNIAFYAITGAIQSYYLTHTEARVLRFALLLPVAFAFLFGLLFWIRDQLKLKSILEVRVLSGFLAVSGLLLFLVAVALLVVVFVPDIIPAPAGLAGV